MRVRMQRDVSRMVRSMLPHAVVTTSRGSDMVLNACVADDANSEMLTAAVKEAAAALSDPANASSAQTVTFAARMAAQEVMFEPDFETLGKHAPPQARDAIEGMWLLSHMNYELAWGVPLAEVRTMLMNLDAHAVAEVLGRLRQEPSVLVLEPGRGNAP
jgi:hypothetical protein